MPFSCTGREYNKDGLLKPWWNKASVARFTKRTECMIDQYSQYKLHGQNVSSSQLVVLGPSLAFLHTCGTHVRVGGMQMDCNAGDTGAKLCGDLQSSMVAKEATAGCLRCLAASR